MKKNTQPQRRAQRHGIFAGFAALMLAAIFILGACPTGGGGGGGGITTVTNDPVTYRSADITLQIGRSAGKAVIVPQTGDWYILVYLGEEISKGTIRASGNTWTFTPSSGLVTGTFTAQKQSSGVQFTSDIKSGDDIIIAHNTTLAVDDGSLVGYLTGHITLDNRPATVKISPYVGAGITNGGAPITRGGYTVENDGSFSIPVTPANLQDFPNGTTNIKWILRGQTEGKDYGIVFGSTPLTVSNGDFNPKDVGELGTYNLATVTLSGTLTLDLSAPANDGKTVRKIFLILRTADGPTVYVGITELEITEDEQSWSLPFPAAAVGQNITRVYVEAQSGRTYRYGGEGTNNDSITVQAGDNSGIVLNDGASIEVTSQTY